jgi:hypothetical protein
VLEVDRASAAAAGDAEAVGVWFLAERADRRDGSEFLRAVIAGIVVSCGPT